MKFSETKDVLISLLAVAATAVMLTVIQAPFEFSYLAWVALVPLILASRPAVKPGPLAAVAYLVGVTYWLANLYWLGFVTFAGWLAFCLYMGLFWPAVAISIRYCKIKKIPQLLALPIIFTGAEALQGYIFTGFSWRFLAFSQYENLRLIQIADIFGAAGISFLIVIVNSLAALLITDLASKKFLRPANFFKTAFVAALLIGTLNYGKWRIDQTPQFIKPGPLVAAVQSNVPLDVKISGQAAEQTFADLLAQSNACIASGAELVVWPETMVQAVLDERFLLLCDPNYRAKVFDKALSDFARGKAFLLVGAQGAKPVIEGNFIKFAETYNSAFLYRPDGMQDRKRYDKIHLVPFGEFVPFKKTFPPLHKLLMKLTPYDYDYTLDSGKEYTIFEIAGKNKSYRFGVLICYEDTVAAIARKMTLVESDPRKTDWLLNISNDGWFVRFVDGKVYPSTELRQHTAICAFRAVENRIPILRSVNTGISCLIDSCGRIRSGYTAGTLPKQAMQRQGVAGWLTDRIYIDQRITFFSKFGTWLNFFCGFCFAYLLFTQATAKIFGT